MGRCKKAGGWDDSATSQEQCELEGGTWVEAPTEPDSWGVLITDLASIEALLNVNVLELAFDIRNEIMTTTTVGEFLLQIYNTHLGEAVRVMRRDQALVLRTLQAWSAVTPFVTQLLVLHRGAEPGAGRFDRKTYNFVADLCNRLARGSRKASFRQALTDLKTECRRYVGLNPREALRVASRELPAGRAARTVQRRKGTRKAAVRKKRTPRRR